MANYLTASTVLFSYGESNGDSAMRAADDSYTTAQPLPQAFPFFGSSYTNVYVSYLKVFPENAIYLANIYKYSHVKLK